VSPQFGPGVKGALRDVRRATGRARGRKATLLNRAIDIPEAVRLRALAPGGAGAAWLAGLAGAVADLAHAWGLAIGRTLSGGTEGLVVEATMADGRPAILKILTPGTSTTGEVQTLLAAGGRGYAEVYAFDPAREALLLERLGPPLAALGAPVDAQIAIICATLVEAWAAAPGGAALMTGAEKARSLADFITTTWEELERPCPAGVVATARRYAERRVRAFDPRTAVLAHGDAHPWNTLLVPGAAPPRYKFVDPDGLFIERAYDLAIPMREWTEELLAGDPLARGQERCRHLARLTGVTPRPIWEWGLIERTSTGLLCLKLGLDGGDAMLAVAERWAGAGT